MRIKQFLLGFGLSLSVAVLALLVVVSIDALVKAAHNTTGMSQKERMAKVEKPSLTELQTETYTVVFCYKEDIPGFQKVILRRMSSESSAEYFAGLASKDELFQPGDVVDVSYVTYTTHEWGASTRFLLVQKRGSFEIPGR